jgi:hypothetical protein
MNTLANEFISNSATLAPVMLRGCSHVGARWGLRWPALILELVPRFMYRTDIKAGAPHPFDGLLSLQSHISSLEMTNEKPTTQTIEMTTPDDAIRAIGAADPVIESDVEEDLKEPAPLPRAEDQLDALGIPNWRELEKQVVRRLDFTLMPCLWCLYLFNYLDRASIGQARISTLQEDINLTDSQFSTAVSILSYG